MIILHIDFDSFFASVAQQNNPQLRNRPVGVTATNGRSAIIAASREAKRMGVRSPTTVSQARMICPDLVTAPADFRRYLAISTHFLSICTRYSPSIEVFSIDELFMDITATAHLFGGTDGVIARIKQDIHHEIGAYITASIGISYNKLLAKLASGMRKPNGVYMITPENLNTVYREAALTDICGIGSRIAKRLNALGIYTLTDLQKAPLAVLTKAFGHVEGHFLYDVGRGEGSIELNAFHRAPDAKSVSRNFCLPENNYSERSVLKHVAELSEEIAIKLRRLKKSAQYIGISMHGSFDFSSYSRSHFVTSGAEIHRICTQLFLQNAALHGWFHTRSDYVRRISIWAGGLIDLDATPMHLFTSQARLDKLQQTIDAINTRFGDHTIRTGFVMDAPRLTTLPNGFLSDRWERLQLAQTAYK
jgi:DNA polymerase-4